MMWHPALLIGDDDRLLRETLGEVFRPRGFRTFLAADGEEVLSILRANEIHVALLDLHMPKLSGLEAIRAVRELRLSLPCVLVSANFDEQIRAQARLLEVVRLLAKPFSLEEVVRTVLEIMEERYGNYVPQFPTKGLKN
ncbi:MAG: response regulator [Thermoguttaceae bacterium]|nr:response regulator [Thermoguttaceae bacterium]MDW8079909.1 response regulator [Thermoguttaceae bacterium]